jgi:hypothetical protein
MFMGQNVTGENVTMDVSSGSKSHSGRNVGGRNVKASITLEFFIQGVTYLLKNESTCTAPIEENDLRLLLIIRRVTVK